MRSRWSVIVLALGLVTAACTSGEQSEAPPTAATAEPVRGGTLVVAVSSDPGGLNPAITTSGGTHTASELMYNGLVGLGPDLEPIPELAESWEIEDGGRVYRFTLRDGVTWHDGQPFTSADVKFSFEEVLLKYHSRTRASLSPALAGIDAPDDRTVVFRFNRPYAPLLLQLDVTEAPIVAQHIYQGSDPQQNPANSSPVGTGPFRFVSYTPGAEIVAERNPDYFKEGLPYLDRVVQRVIPEESNQVIALEAGEVQWIWGVPGPDERRLEGDENFELLRTDRSPGGSNCIMTMSFNLQRPIFADERVRRAIAQGIDRQQFVERVLFGQGRVAEAPISSGIPWAHAENLDLPEYDQAAAERLLDQAGWRRTGDGPRAAQGVAGVPDGTPLRFDFLHFPTFSQDGELLRAQLAAAGIDLVLTPLEPPVFADTVFTQRAFDTNIISYCNGNDPEIGVRRMYDSTQIGPVPFSNAAAYTNPEVNALFTQASQTIATEDRSPIYGRIQQIVGRDLPYWWIVETSSTRAHSARCTGFTPYAQFAEAAYCRPQ